MKLTLHWIFNIFLFSIFLLDIIDAIANSRPKTLNSRSIFDLFIYKFVCLTYIQLNPFLIYNLILIWSEYLKTT